MKWGANLMNGSDAGFLSWLLGGLPAGVARDFSVAGAFEFLFGLGRGLIRIILILILATVAIKIGNMLIDRILGRALTRQGRFMDERKLKTLSRLAKNVMRYVIYFVAGVMILDEFGINTASLLAGAGIAGLAVGFGAQNLVRDVINGFFLLFEDQFGVGDYVTLGDISGVVEEMGLRVTKVRDFGGQLHIVPNGQISRVTNHMGAAMRVMFDVDVHYDTDINYALEVLQKAFEKARQEIDTIVDGPTALGVRELGDSSIKILVLARTKPMEQWAVERELKRRIKYALDEAGIQIPYPHRTVVVERKEKKASTPRPSDDRKEEE